MDFHNFEKERSAMERSPLNNPASFPTLEAIAATLQAAQPVYTEFTAYLNAPENGLDPAWLYYNDVKYWLCKVQHKKKTVFWLTIWDGYFKLTFYFTAKHTAGLQALAIDPAVRQQHLANQQSGKVRPITLDITLPSQLPDAYTLIEFKKALKS